MVEAFVDFPPVRLRSSEVVSVLDGSTPVSIASPELNRAYLAELRLRASRRRTDKLFNGLSGCTLP